MKTPFAGGCLCGAVRYECAAEPIISGFCHCRNCQKLSGTAFATALAVPSEALKIRGKLTYYEIKADSGNTTRNGFCPTCGSRVFGGSTGMPGMTVVFAGSLDDPSALHPGMHVYTASAQPWDKIGADLPRFPGMPEMPEAAKA